MINKAGADWVILKRYIDEEIETIRSRLEDYQPPEITHADRGRVAALRDLIKFATPSQAEEIKEDPYV